ncbi:hypothetical protein TWF694_006347 [Orbilia ellipsospora]|uniref:Uncharacterized protein n=1 Tax=Orbilia ellipsospora TaxID=2528407 RepID=A0AAV9XN96_9PEZI
MQLKGALVSLGLLSQGLGVLAGPVQQADSSVKVPGSGTLGSQWEIPEGYDVLQPVHTPVPSHVLKREDHVKTAFNPTTTATLKYVGQKSGGAAHVQLQVDKSHPILDLQDIEPLVETVEVFEKGANVIGMVFRSEETKKIALKAWDWVNNNQADYFVLIVTSPDPKDPRIVRKLPYKVDNVEEKDLKVSLHTTEVPWDSLGSLDIRIGGTTPDVKAAIVPKSTTSRRGVFEPADFDRYWSIPIAHGDEKSEVTFVSLSKKPWEKTIKEEEKPQTDKEKDEKTSKNGSKGASSSTSIEGKLELKCVGCYTTGQFDFEAHFHFNAFGAATGSSEGLTEANVAVRTHGISINVGLDLVASLTAKQQFKYNLYTVDVVGLAVAGMANFGPAISFDVAKEISLAGKFDARASMKVKIPDDQIILDLKEPGKTHAPNWKPQVEWDINVKEASVEFKGAMGLIANIGLTAQLLKQGFKSGFNLWLPKFEYGVKAGYADNFCPATAPTKRGLLMTSVNAESSMVYRPVYGKREIPVTNPDKMLTPTDKDKPTKTGSLGVSASAQAGIEINFTALEGTGAFSFLKLGVLPIMKPNMFPIGSFCRDTKVNWRAGVSSPTTEEVPKKFCSQTWYGSSPACDGQCPPGTTQVRRSDTSTHCDESTPEKEITCHGMTENVCSGSTTRALCEICT